MYGDQLIQLQEGYVLPSFGNACCQSLSSRYLVGIETWTWAVCDCPDFCEQKVLFEYCRRLLIC
jgi:hypothetical protein